MLSMSIDEVCAPFRVSQMKSVLPLLTHDGMVQPPALAILSAVLAGIMGVLVLLSILAIVTLLKNREGAYFVHRVNSYTVPNSTLLGVISLSLYAGLAFATAMYLHLRVYGGRELMDLIILTSLLPAPLFLWAWWQTMGAVYSYHLSQRHNTKQRWMIAPEKLRAIMMFVPIVLVVTIVLGVALPMNIEAIRSWNWVADAGRKYTAVPQYLPAEIELSIHNYVRPCINYQILSRIQAGCWLLAFSATLIVYIIYSTLFLRSMRAQISFYDLRLTDSIPVPPRVKRMGSGLEKLPHAEKLSGMMMFAGSKEKVDEIKIPRLHVSKHAHKAHRDQRKALAMLQKTARLNLIEAIAVSAYLAVFLAILLHRTVLGGLQPRALAAWVRMVAIEFSHAAVLAGANLVTVMMRGKNSMKTRRRRRERLSNRRGSASVSLASIHVTVQTQQAVEQVVDGDLMFSSDDESDLTGGAELASFSESRRTSLASTKANEAISWWGQESAAPGPGSDDGAPSRQGGRRLSERRRSSMMSIAMPATATWEAPREWLGPPDEQLEEVSSKRNSVRKVSLASSLPGTTLESLGLPPPLPSAVTRATNQDRPTFRRSVSFEVGAKPSTTRLNGPNAVRGSSLVRTPSHPAAQ